MDWSELIAQFLPWALAGLGTLLSATLWQKISKILKGVKEFHDILAEIQTAYENDQKVDATEALKIITQYNEFVVYIGKPQWKVKV